MGSQLRAHIISLRSNLEGLELARTDEGQRRTQWDAARWEETLEKLCSTQDQLYRESRAQLIQDGHSHAWHTQREQELEREIRESISWLIEHDKRLDGAARRWHALRVGDVRLIELERHRPVLRWHILAERIRLEEFALDCAERQRYTLGHLGRIDWKASWDSLQRLWAQQDSDAQLGPSDKQRWLKQHRYEWLKGLQAAQEQARARVTNDHDRATFSQQVALVDKAVGDYTEQPTRLSGGESGVGAGAMLIVLLIIAAMLSGARGTSHNSSRSQPMSPTPSYQEQAPPHSGAEGILQSTELPDPALIPAARAADLIVRGEERRRAGSCTEAVQLFEQAIAADQSFVNVRSSLALCLYELGRTDEAVQFWEDELRRNPGAPEALAGLATALYARGEQATGIDRYRQAVEGDGRYADEAFLRAERGWSESAILSSRPLREALAPRG